MASMYRLILTILLLCPFAAAAREAPRGCQTHFNDREMPDVDPAAIGRTRLLCRGGFALLHSARNRTPVWVAEHLTARRVRAAEQLSRPDPGPFHPEPRLPPGQRAELRDYRGSGFDRGHMAPNGDMATPKTQVESFSLANMIPQDPCNNQRLWRGLEELTRQMVEEGTELYVVTGPIYDADPPDEIGNGVKVPTRIFKAILQVKSGRAAAYVVLNNDVTPVERVSIAELAEITGIDVFPTLGARARRDKAELPEPSASLMGCARH